MTNNPKADQDWWRGAVIYQIYPRSFLDSNADGIGDLPGIISRLDHIAALGVDAVWLSPFFQSPQKDFGYDISDYENVDPIFGTLADIDHLIDKAHRLGLKVIIDQVYCHTSDQHEWFEESRQNRTNPKADWFVWADPKPEGSPPSNWQSVFGGPAWSWNARRGQYYLHNFLKEQPQLNLHNPEVQEAILQTTKFWLDRGADGLRLDAISFAMHDPTLIDNPPSGRPLDQVTRPFDMQQHTFNQSHPNTTAFLERIRSLIDEYPNRFTVAEIPGEDPFAQMCEYTTPGSRLHTAYGFDFLYAPSLSPETVKAALTPWNANTQNWPSWAFSNHDAPRAVSRWAKPEWREDAARLYLLLLLSLRGTLFLYQGEELGLPQANVAFEDLQDPEAIANWPRTLGRDGARTPIAWDGTKVHAGFSSIKPWLPVDPDHYLLAVKQQDTDPTSILQLTRKIIRIRNKYPAMRTGEMAFLDTQDPILAFKRSTGPQDPSPVLCVYNLSPEAVPFPANLPAGGNIIAATQVEFIGQKMPPILNPYQGYWLS